MKSIKFNFILILAGVMLASFNYEATYYADYFNGRPTRSGEIFSQDKLTCASNKFAIGSRLKITNKENGKSVTVRVNDTGPADLKVVDLSKKAFRKIADLENGRIKIIIKHLKK
jgi:rare lipoprotein A